MPDDRVANDWAEREREREREREMNKETVFTHRLLVINARTMPLQCLSSVPPCLRERIKTQTYPSRSNRNVRLVPP